MIIWGKRSLVTYMLIIACCNACIDMFSRRLQSWEMSNQRHTFCQSCPNNFQHRSIHSLTNFR